MIDETPEWEKPNAPKQNNGGNAVIFYKRAKQNEDKSKEAGRAIYDMRDYVKIITPASRDEVDVPVQDKHKEAYPRQWAAFVDNKDQDTASGTLLSVWGGVPPERVEEYIFKKIRTVEQLAAVSDGNLQNLGMGAQADRKRAVEWLAAMSGKAPVMALQAEVEALRGEREIMAKRMSQLEESNAVLMQTLNQFRTEAFGGRNVGAIPHSNPSP